MTRSLLRPLAALLVLLVVAACATTQEAAPPAVPASPVFLWKVSQEGQPGAVYLLGTVHLRDLSSVSLDQAVLDRFDAADEVVFELVPDERNNRQIEAVTKTLGLLPEGESLLERLDDESRAILTQSAPKLGLPVEAVTRMRPWLASITLAVLRMEREGYSAEAGVEKLLLARAREQKGKRLSSLEAAEEQLRVFADMPEEAQLAMLRETLTEVREQKDQVEEIQRAYTSGDEEALAALLFKGRNEDPAADALYRALFDERNVRMVERLLPYLEKDQQTLVALGAGHMLGDAGIPALLLARGLRVEAVPAQGLVPVKARVPVPVSQFSDEELGFEALFHVAPRVARQKLPTPDGGTAELVMVTANDGVLELSVMVNRLPGPIDHEPALVDKMLGGMVASMGQQIGSLEQNERVTVRGRPAVRFVASGPTHRVEGLVLARGARVYMVLASRSGEVGERAETQLAKRVELFLTSFALHDDATEQRPAGEAPAAPAVEDEAPLSL